MPCESVKGNKASLPEYIVSASGCRGIACDLIKFDRKYEGIFNYLLGKTVIVDNMQNAIDFSKKIGFGVRFVTVEGEVVNASGAITGGKYKNATANLLERKSEIDSLSQKIKSLENDFEMKQTEAKDAADKIDNSKKELEKLESEFNKIQIEVLGLKSRIEAAQTFVDDMTANNSRQEQQLISIDKDYLSAEEMSKRLSDEAAICQKEGEELQSSIASLMEAQEIAKKHVDEASEDITAVRIEKNSLDGNKENLVQMLQRIMSDTEDFEMQIGAKKEALEDLKTEKNQIIFGSGDVEEKVKLKTEEKNSLEEYISELSVKRSELSANLEEMLKEQTSALDKINAYQDQKYQEEIKFAKNEK